MSDSLAELYRQIDNCLAVDRQRLIRSLKQIRERMRSKQPVDKLLTGLEDGIAKSSAIVTARRTALPRPTFDDALPVCQKLDEIKDAIAQNQVVIVCGETGSGKTTQLPKICLELGRGVHGLIGHTQPRRLAARSVASRIAQELQTELGSAVGFKVRFTDRSSSSSYIKLMTDGILLAETLSDQYLNAYDTIIIDEAHERSLNIDFLLGYLKQLLPKRPDLKVIVTSATIDAERFSCHFNNAPVLEVSGRTYPVEVRFKPLGAEDEDDQELEMEDAVVAAVEELWRKDGAGDVLVFLPGEREIRETAEELRRAKLMGAEILPLFARLSNEDQQRIFRPGNGRRIVLATNVAETSLTVPGIRYVIDSGLARVNRYSPRAKVEQLLVEKISQASARQRAGRCGRVSAGVCVRLYSELDFAGRAEFTDPEIVRSSLAAVILRMAALKLGRVDEFPFIEAPSGRLIADGYNQLHELGAVDAVNELTALGKQLARLPVDPKLGRMLLAGRDENCLKEILIIASGLSVQDPRERPFDARDAADRMQAKFRDDKSDFLSWLLLWDFFAEAEAGKTSNRQLVNLCHEHFLSFLRLREWRDLHRQLLEIVEETFGKNPPQSPFDKGGSQAPENQVSNSTGQIPPFEKGGRGGISAREQERNRPLLNEAPATYEQIHKALLTGLLGNLGMKSTDSDEYLGARGIKYSVFPGSCLKKNRPKWIVAAELVETSKLFGRCVAAIEPEWVERLAPHLVSRQYFDPHWEKDGAQVMATERVTLYGLPIVNRRRVHYGRINPKEARDIFIREGLVKFNFNTKGKFNDHNLELLLEVEELEHKARRQDVLVDEEALFGFFDARIPADIFNGSGFEVWRREAEKTNPKLLFLSRDDLMQHSASSVTEEQYPASFRLHDAEIALAYRFDPGHALDGVTATLPLHLLNRVNHAVFDWLVPGLLREKVTALVKSLPKTIRRQCVPVPEFATRMLLELDRANRTAPLLPQLAQAVTRGIGQPVSVEDFDGCDLPPHLRMNFRIVDDAGLELASGRDLVALRAQLGEAAQITFRDAAEERPAIEKHGIIKWDFGDLPEKIAFKRQGQTINGYPALVPEDDAVAIRLFDTEHAAAEAHRQGVLKLLSFELKEQIKQLPKCFANFNQFAIQLRALSNSDDLMDDLVGCICDRAFLGEDELPRKKKDFDDQKNRAKVRLPSVRDAAWRSLGEVTAEYVALNQLLAKPGAITHELKAQLGQLVYKGFLRATPWEQLPRLPVYLKAMRLRSEKRTANPARDAQRAADVAALWSKWEAEIKKWQAEGRDTAPLLPFRWMIEELRVGLFAQELRTPYPVSGKRLAKIWEEITRR